MIKFKKQNCDLSLIKCSELIASERVKLGIDKKTKSFRRITKAIANLLMTDIEVRKRIINANIEDDRGKNGYD